MPNAKKPRPSRRLPRGKAARMTTPKPRLLDEDASARVLAEYIAIGDVETSEIDSIMEVERALSYRELALVFRVSEVLDIPAPFEIAPRYAEAFARARLLMRARDATPPQR